MMNENELVDVGLKGVNKQEIKNGNAFFNALKFNSTSYNNEGDCFFLLIVLYIEEDEDDFCQP